MKKIFTLLLLSAAFSTHAQDSNQGTPKDTSWKINGLIGLNITNTSLNNWQGGGSNNFALNAIFNMEAIYKKGDVEFLNKIDAQYGLIRPGQDALRKNMDQLFLLMKFNKRAFNQPHWYYSLQGDYRTQFAPGFKYENGQPVGQAVSDFNSPGYVQAALGLDYKPNSYFSAAISPIAGKITIVNRQYLADDGMYGVKPATYDAGGVRLTAGQKIRYEYGGRMVVKFKKEVAKGFTIDSYLDLFSNYTNNPGNIDVVFNNLFSYKLNKLLTLTFICQMVYDDDITVKRDWNGNGIIEAADGDINGPRLQALTTWGIGFSFKY
jgi:hypothetical protein